MSRARNGSIRCDWCGKLTASQDGAYRLPGHTDGAVGYMHSPDWDKDSDTDICEECFRNHCPLCGSAKIVHTVPQVPGPIGWGGRCKDCGGHWGLPTSKEDDAPQCLDCGLYYMPGDHHECPEIGAHSVIAWSFQTNS